MRLMRYSNNLHNGERAWPPLWCGIHSLSNTAALSAPSLVVHTRATLNPLSCRRGKNVTLPDTKKKPTTTTPSNVRH